MTGSHQDSSCLCSLHGFYGVSDGCKECILELENLRGGPDESCVSVNEILFRGMIGSLMYLIASRPDIQFSTCLYARYQANPKESHLIAIKRIFRALTLQPTAMYVEYLKEFWYTAEVKEETKTITFLLSWWDNPSEEQSMEFSTVKQLLDEADKLNKAIQETPESPYDTDLPDHMDHIFEEVGSLHSKLEDMKSSIVQQVSAKFKSSLPALVTDSLKEQLPSFLSDVLKDTLP
nr:retrovirus-related Pol polyprotein from transposon TNT 1-94 [Tanacetum cinerariifolium]